MWDQELFVRNVDAVYSRAAEFTEVHKLNERAAFAGVEREARRVVGERGAYTWVHPPRREPLAQIDDSIRHATEGVFHPVVITRPIIMVG